MMFNMKNTHTPRQILSHIRPHLPTPSVITGMRRTLGVAGWSNLIPVFSFSSIRYDLFFNVPNPWQYCLSHLRPTCLHPRSLRACAELKRASARRGKAPLELNFFLFTNYTAAWHGTAWRVHPCTRKPKVVLWRLHPTMFSWFRMHVF